ncbi:lymphocyte cytosolic protein 2a isoform X2 [Siniperca chuatsi]|uniref:lymphocyte cytosolic protein 2a isoform X2 n=1 Tax=Siniperca chuatsi TaxID=119488 RepID=UPI001CE1D596|nr:lymphocyte cytosolic protein 2a isoform X2 [Siniperca chuatsi]
MSSDRVPSRSEVMGWSPQQLADYLKRMSLSGCDKAVLKNSISGSRFVNLSDNDLQKFPKLHAPMISKISTEISKKEERRGLFGKKATPKYHEPDTAADVQGWAEDEFDEEFDDDYESPYSGDEEGSGGDYESPNDDLDAANDYEPPPSEPPEDLAHKLCPTLPIGDSDYIDNRDNHVSSRGPPALCPRPPVSTLSAPSSRMPGESSSSRRDHSPHSGGRLPGKLPPGPPQIFRGTKPGRDSGSNQSPIRGPHRNTVDRPATQAWRPQADVPEPPTWPKPPILLPSSTSINRSNSSVKPPPNRTDVRREQTHDEAPKHNTFPLHNKSLPPRPGLPGPPSRHGDSLPPSVPSAGSLPHKLHSALAEQRGSVVGSDRQSFRPAPPTAASTQELDPRWYVGRVTRGQAEGCLKQVCKSFPSVSDIICHYSQSPLLLIDAKNRDSSQQNQCLLSDPAGYYMTRQNWS